MSNGNPLAVLVQPEFRTSAALGIAEISSASGSHVRSLIDAIKTEPNLDLIWKWRGIMPDEGRNRSSIEISEKAILAQHLSTQGSSAPAGLKRAGCDPDSVSQANGHEELESVPAK